MAPSQKKKNVEELHAAAKRNGFNPLLEVSSKSEWEVGQKLSAFYVKMEVLGRSTTLESAYQASKVFENGGPFLDLLNFESRDAKRDSRLRDSGRLIGFKFEDQDYPLSPVSAFYDWLYLRALFPHEAWLVKRLAEFQGFTDIEFNPERSLNCQARSCATFMSLAARNELARSVRTFDYFRELLQRGAL